MEAQPDEDQAWDWALTLIEHLADLEAPQDTTPSALATLFAPDPLGRFARRIRELLFMSARLGDVRAGAADLRKAADLLLAVLSAESGITLNDRDLAMFEMGRATGRWEAQEEAKGGVIAGRARKVERRVNAWLSTAKGKAEMSKVDEAINRHLPTLASERTKAAKIVKLRALLKQDGFDRGTSEERLKRHPAMQGMASQIPRRVKRSLH